MEAITGTPGGKMMEVKNNSTAALRPGVQVYGLFT